MKKQVLITMSIEEFQAIIQGVVSQEFNKIRQKQKLRTEDNCHLLSRNQAAEFLMITLVTLSDWSK